MNKTSQAVCLRRALDCVCLLPRKTGATSQWSSVKEGDYRNVAYQQY